MWPIPAELTLLIANYLQRSDLLAFSCISCYYRKLLLSLLFSKVQLKGTRKSKGLRIFTSSEQDVKDTIRSLTVETLTADLFRVVRDAPSLRKVYRCNNHELFQFLPTLNNLQFLSIDPEFTLFFNTSHIPALMEATKHAPLRQLSLSINVKPQPSSVITLGPTGLDTLCVRWNTDMLSPEHKPGGAFDHLLALITPSLASLSHLELSFDNWEKPVSNTFDLTLLKAAGPGENMQSFQLEATQEAGFVVADNPFRIVAETFPKLTKLTMLDDNAVWNDDCVDSFALLPCLTHLTLSSNLEKEDWLINDHDFAWYRRCFYRRFHATEKIFAKCPQLERCSWRQKPINSERKPMFHNFVVVDTDQGRVLKPVMQWWMWDHYKYEEHGDPLLEDMVKEDALRRYDRQCVTRRK